MCEKILPKTNQVIKKFEIFSLNWITKLKLQIINFLGLMGWWRLNKIYVHESVELIDQFILKTELVWSVKMESSSNEILSLLFIDKYFLDNKKIRKFNLNQQFLLIYLRLFSVIVEMFQVLLNRIYRLINFIHSLKMLIWNCLRNTLREISGNCRWSLWTKKSLQKFSY